MSTTEAPTRKRAVSTRRILEESIADIEAGLWICGDLCELNENEGATKPMGCALGLVGINAGYAKIRNTSYGVTANVDYPRDDWARPAIKAVTLLAEAARPTKTQVDEARAEAGEAAGLAVPFEQGIVWRVNDADGMTPRKALNWFRRALALLDA
jgi:hypothetical protein